MSSVITLTRKCLALVDSEDLEELTRYHWFTVGTAPYLRAARSITVVPYRKQFFYMHREILGLPPGREPVVDHINGNPLDNRRQNLRLCSAGENSWNRRRRATIFGLSPFIGVIWRSHARAFQAHARRDGRFVHLGWFKDPVAPAQARDAGVLGFRGAFAVLNFPT